MIVTLKNNTEDDAGMRRMVSLALLAEALPACQ